MSLQPRQLGGDLGTFCSTEGAEAFERQLPAFAQLFVAEHRHDQGDLATALRGGDVPLELISASVDMVAGR